MPLTKMQRTVLLHPAWETGAPVTAAELVSTRPGDGLPKTAKGAQQVLSVLNGGRQGLGERWTDWTPHAVEGKRFAYVINAHGEETRQAEVA